MFQDMFIVLYHDNIHSVTEMCYCIKWDILCLFLLQTEINPLPFNHKWTSVI
jgi:hypothetical protein